MKFEYDFYRRKISRIKFDSDTELKRVKEIEIESDDNSEKIIIRFNPISDSSIEPSKGFFKNLIEFIKEWKWIITTIVIPTFTYFAANLTGILAYISDIVKYAIVFGMIIITIIIIYRKKNRK